MRYEVHQTADLFEVRDTLTGSTVLSTHYAWYARVYAWWANR